MSPVETELERLRRLETLAELLPALTGVLDVRQVFGRLSEITRRVLPHDAMAIALFAGHPNQVRVYAVSSDIDFERPELIDVPKEERERLQEPWEFLIIDDMREVSWWRDAVPARAGFRASLRVPLRIDGVLKGGINFLSRSVGVFGETDVPVAQRVANFVSMALSHQQLAEEAARAAEARERAAKLERRVSDLTEQLASLGAPGHRITGTSAAWMHVLNEAARVAATDATVLLTGESGTGKEVVARFIHHASPRANAPFVGLNCAALPESLLESELFGYERGAFTGATQSKPGRLEQAAGGIVFLDEVGEMSRAVQAKFLRVLQEREFQRLGGTRTLRTDARFIAASNRDLRRMVAQGEFRDDLFYRLHVFELHLPPLRERPDDILPLCEVFLEEIGRGLGRPPAGLSRDARPLLVEYPWPGNVRELRNALERASILADGGLITREHLNALSPPEEEDAAAPRSTAVFGVMPSAERPSRPPVSSPSPGWPSSDTGLEVRGRHPDERSRDRGTLADRNRAGARALQQSARRSRSRSDPDPALRSLASLRPLRRPPAPTPQSDSFINVHSVYK